MKKNVTDTSIEIYHEVVTRTRGNVHEQIIDAFRLERSFTNHELAEFLRIEINVITARVHELRQPEWGTMLESAGKRKCKITGNTCLSWRGTFRDACPEYARGIIRLPEGLQTTMFTISAEFRNDTERLNMPYKGHRKAKTVTDAIEI